MHSPYQSRVVSLIFAFFLLPASAYAGDATPVVAGKSAYRLPLFHGANGLQIPEAETSMAADPDSSDPPRISIDIFEPSGAGPGAMKWQSFFSPLSAGDELVVQGRLYRVTWIDEGWLVASKKSAWKCKQKSCEPYVDVAMLPQVVSTAGQNALVVPHRGPYPDEPQPAIPIYTSALIYTTMDQCILDLSLGTLSKDSHGYVAHMQSKLDAIYYQGDVSKCHENVQVGQFDASIGDTVNFGGFGSFKVDSIWPAAPNHRAWVVLVPTKGK